VKFTTSTDAHGTKAAAWSSAGVRRIPGVDYRASPWPIDWKRDDPTVGEDSFPLHWNGTTIFPYGWCLKRILDGPADECRFKWQVFVLNPNGGSAAR